MRLLLLFLSLPLRREKLSRAERESRGSFWFMSFFGLFGSFGFPIRQPNERDKLNKPNKRNEPVWFLPTAAAFELKGADPTTIPLALTRASPVHGTSRLSKEICNSLLDYAALFFTRTSAR